MEPGSPRRAGRPARRDRRGRGLRGPLTPPGLPVSRSRAQRFDDLVLDAVESLERHWREPLGSVEFAVEDVPPVEGWDRDWVPLARAFPAEGALPARVVVYRRPVESRAPGGPLLRELVHDLVVEEVAELLGVDPEQLDPDHGLDDEDGGRD